MEKTFKIDYFKVLNGPNSAFYIQNFITADEEELLLNQIKNSPKPKWTQLSNRRLQNWGGLPHPKGMIAETIPSWLDKYLLKLQKNNIFDNHKPNHVLINEYLPGQGIMPHVDGPLFYPTIATINLGSHAMLDFYKPLLADDSDNCNPSDDLATRYIGTFLLERRSLVCFKEEMYHKYLHGIREIKVDDVGKSNILNGKSLELGLDNVTLLERSTRTSVTIRYFPKVLNMKLKFGKR